MIFTYLISFTTSVSVQEWDRRVPKGQLLVSRSILFLKGSRGPASRVDGGSRRVHLNKHKEMRKVCDLIARHTRTSYWAGRPARGRSAAWDAHPKAIVQWRRS